MSTCKTQHQQKIKDEAEARYSRDATTPIQENYNLLKQRIAYEQGANSKAVQEMYKGFYEWLITNQKYASSNETSFRNLYIETSPQVFRDKTFDELLKSIWRRKYERFKTTD